MTKFEQLRAMLNPTNLSDESMNGFIIENIESININDFIDRNGKPSQSVTFVCTDGHAYRCGTLSAIDTARKVMEFCEGDYEGMKLMVVHTTSQKGNKTVKIVLP